MTGWGTSSRIFGPSGRRSASSGCGESAIEPQGRAGAATEGGTLGPGRWRARRTVMGGAWGCRRGPHFAWAPCYSDLSDDPERPAGRRSPKAPALFLPPAQVMSKQSNVVPLREADYPAPSPHAQQFEHLLEKCRNLAHARLSQSLAGMLHNAG